MVFKIVGVDENAHFPPRVETRLAADFGGTGTGGSTDPEVVRDVVGAALKAGTGITVTADDTADTITIAATGGSNSVAKDSLVVNVKDHGVVGNNVVDDTAALNAAANYALSLGASATLFMPPGNYKITGTVQVQTNLSASMASLQYTGTGNALFIGSTTAGVQTKFKTLFLPQVWSTTQTWGTQATQGTSQGVVLQNLNVCEVHVPYIKWFTQGLRCQGSGTGFAYNTIFVGELRHNRRQLILDSTPNPGGWCNQNLFLGGHLEQNSTDTTTTMWMDDGNTNLLALGVTTGSSPNNNTFMNMALEGNVPSQYRLRCNGQFNKWINCRWENNGGNSRVLWQAGADHNRIEGGYDASELVDTYTVGSTNNVIIGHNRAYIQATNVSAPSVQAGDQTQFQTIGGWVSDDLFATYSPTTGEWMPRQGRWRFDATVVVDTPSAASDVNGRLWVANSRAISYDNQQVIVGGRAWLHLSGSDYFSGTDAVEIQVRRDATNSRPVAGQSGYNTFHAEYLG